MKNNNTVEACTHCHVCQNQCEFLKKYGIDIGDTEKLKELSYHCFLCGKCTEVCPENIDGREYILNLRREKVEKSGGTLEEKGYGMLLKEKKDYIYLGIPIVANIISIIVIFGYIFNVKDINHMENIIMIIVSIVLLFSNISLVSIIGRIIKDNKIRVEHEITKEKMNMQYKYYLNLQESQEKIKKLYHDMNNHIICIQNIYGKHEIANKYIEDINNQIKGCSSIFDTKNIILDVILNEKKSICDKNDIDFLVDIDFSECGFIEITDICSIFSNMIDNAIEACLKIKDSNIDKKIKLRGTLVNRFFVIKCKNTKVNNVNSKNNKLITDKKDLFLHGIGIDSIRSSVKKYNGNVEINLDKNSFTMIIYIPIKGMYTQLGI